MKQKFFKYTICKLLIVVMLVPMLQACEMIAAGSVAGVFAYFLGKKSAQRGDTAVKNEALVEVRREMEEKQKAVASTDDNIGNDINQRLVSGAVDQQLAVYPEVKNGVVILHGRVPDAKAAEKVIQSARSAPGVSRIISNLVIVNQQQQSPVPYAGQQMQQRAVGQMVTPQQMPQQVIPLQPVQQPAYPVYPQQQMQQPQLMPLYPQQPQPVYPQQQQIQPQQQQYPYPPQQQRYQQYPQQQQQYPPQTYYQDPSAEKKSLNSASEADQKKNLKRPANQFINSGYYYDQYGNVYYYPQLQLQQQPLEPQKPAIMPEKVIENYSDNDSAYVKFNEYRRPASQMNKNNQVNGDIDIPVPTPSVTSDYDEAYRPLGSYNPSGPVQYTMPAIPVPTPAIPYDQDEYYRPLGAYNPAPVQPTNFQYVSPGEEPNADALDIPAPVPTDDNDGNYYYFY